MNGVAVGVIISFLQYGGLVCGSVCCDSGRRAGSGSDSASFNCAPLWIKAAAE